MEVVIAKESDIANKITAGKHYTIDNERTVKNSIAKRRTVYVLVRNDVNDSVWVKKDLFK